MSALSIQKTPLLLALRELSIKASEQKQLFQEDEGTIWGLWQIGEDSLLKSCVATEIINT